MKQIVKVGLGLALCAASTSLWAVTLGEASDNLFGPLAVITKLVVLVCYAVGVAFCIGALMQYRQHRRNPKLVPLTTPVLLIILGGMALLLPYFSTDIINSWSATVQERDDSAVENPYNPNVIPQPRETRYPKRGDSSSESVDEDVEEEGSGHWSDNL